MTTTTETRDAEIAQQLRRADVATDEPERRCNWCGTAINEDSRGGWLDAMDDGHCEKNEDGHEPEPTDRDFWVDGSRGDSLWLDTTVTPDGSPVSVTFRHVLAYGLVNSSGEAVTFDLSLYRAYHAAGTNVPELDEPWHLTREPRSGWTTMEAAQRWAEKGTDVDAWDFDNDALYKAQVELVTAVKQAQAARDDRLAVDKIATLIGTAVAWDRPWEFLDDIGQIIERVRPGVGAEPDDYAAKFLTATGRAVDAEFDQR